MVNHTLIDVPLANVYLDSPYYKGHCRVMCVSSPVYPVIIGRSFNQLVVPKELRRQVMSVNHELAFSGHLGAKKTEVRILPNFFWPGLHQEVIRLCRSCDVCQRTVKRGSVKKVPLGSMPLINTPFKRVAVDIVRPIAPPSEAGHRCILTLVDYATGYQEAVPFKKITTEAVADSLLDIYSRVGIPEEVLTDQGTQFMSECRWYPDYSVLRA